jgi:hypothetical protein
MGESRVTNRLLGEGLAFLFEMHDLGLPPGVYHASTDMSEPQSQEWKCGGCSGIGHTYWPVWGEPDFKHDADCKYMAARDALKRYKDSEHG